MTTAIERLEELLDEKDAEIEKLQDQNKALERELRGSLDGWRRETTIEDDGVLAVPRLELICEPHEERGWHDHTVTYRMVYRHLLDHLVAMPLGCTRISGGSGARPTHLPFRDGAHAMHDGAHFGLPLYSIIPGEPPKLLDGADYPHQRRMGAEHRRAHGKENR